jgi:tetratricopeptide (TPR) repeat protein
MKKALLLAAVLHASACSRSEEQAQNIYSLPDAQANAVAPLAAGDIDLLRQAAEADPNDGGAQDAYAAALLVSGKGGDALTRLHALPATPQRQRLRGDALVMLGRYKEAVEAYRAAGDQEGSAAQLRQTLRLVGDGAIQGRRWRDAIGAYEELRAGGDADPLILNNLAYAYGEMKDYGKAIPLARDAVSRAPDSAAALDTLGWLLVTSGRDVAEGKALLQRAADLAPEDKAIRAHLDAAGRH